MDDKLRSILTNPELMARIASAVKGATAEEAPPPQTPRYPTEELYAPPAENRSDKALALLYALRPFLSSTRQSKLESVTKAMTVANVYKNTKKL